MNHYSVVYIQGQGYGYLTPKDWANIPVLHRSRVHVLAGFSTELEAQRAYNALPPEWADKSKLHYHNGEWWQSTDEVITYAGRETELFILADRPVPTIQHQVSETELPRPTRTLGLPARLA